MDIWPQSISEAYSDIDRWIPPKFSDVTLSKPTAFAATTWKDAPWQKFPCNLCWKLGHLKKHCPDAKAVGKVPAPKSKVMDALHKVPSTRNKKDNHANLSVQQAIDKLSNNNDIFHLTSIVLKGSSDISLSKPSTTLAPILMSQMMRHCSLPVNLRSMQVLLESVIAMFKLEWAIY